MDNNNNNSKQIILSIVGIAILVIAVVGVSFAFFAYSKTGTNSNTLQGGSIVLNVEPGEEHENIVGTNRFPQDDDEGASDPENMIDFDIVGTLPTGHKVIYAIYAIEGASPVEEAPSGAEAWEPLPHDAIKMKLTLKDGTGDIDNDYENATLAGEFEDVSFADNAKGFLLATGSMEGNDSMAVTHKFQLSMWITKDYKGGKIISDTNKDYAYRASSAETGDKPTDAQDDSRKVWSDTYYSVRLRVTATDDLSKLGGA